MAKKTLDTCLRHYLKCIRKQIDIEVDVKQVSVHPGLSFELAWQAPHPKGL